MHTLKHTLNRMHWTSRLLLGGALLVHLLMLVSWRTGTLNPLFFDATVTHGRRGWDFYALYQAGHNVLTGHSAYESDGTQIDMVIPDGTYTPFRYLPISAYTVGLALNLVSPLWAYRLWVAAIELCLLGCLWLTTRLTPDPDCQARLAAMWLCYTPFYLELYMGQFSFVQGALVFVLFYFEHHNHPQRAGWAWISSVLWKQNTALLLPFWVRARRWRTLLMLVLALLVTTVPYFLLVPGSMDAFMRNMHSEPPWFQIGNQGLRQLLFDAMWSLGDTTGWTISPQMYAGTQTALVVILLALPALLTVIDPQPNTLRHIALWMTTYFLIYHHVWEHHYVMLLPILVLLAWKEHGMLPVIVYVLLALPTPYFLIDPQGQVRILDAMRWTPIRPLWQDLWLHASKSVPTLALYAWLVWRLLKPTIQVWQQGRFVLWPLLDTGEPA